MLYLLYLFPGGDTTKFSIHSTSGELSTTAPLDYESATSYTLYIVAYDSGGATGAKTSTAVVTVNVGPVNEYSPMFDQSSYSANVNENTEIGTSVVRISATDRDHGNDGLVYYSLENSNDFFYLDPTTGDIFVKKKLDYETSTQHIFNIIARDSSSASKHNTTTITINVNDVNEFSPQCSPNLVIVSYNESLASGSVVASMSCDDSDRTTAPNNLQYDILSVNSIPGADVFSINGNTGVLTLSGTFDYEDKEDYNILVAVKDNGTPILSSTATVRVEVTDVNEFTPNFIIAGNVTISESLQAGDNVTKVSATDDDSSQTLTYSFQTASSNFAINPTDGNIFLRNEIDYDALIQKYFVLTVVAVDNGVNPKTGTASLTVSITGINDARPYFQPAVYYASVPENNGSASSVVITTVTAKDSDDGDTLVYRLVDGFSIFEIDSSLGVISLLPMSGDYEGTKSYSLVVNAVDSTSNTVSTTVHVLITGVNEDSPTFIPASVSVSINENVPLEDIVIQLNASDSDDGPDGELTYNLTTVPTGFENLLAVDPVTGAVSVADVIDREVVPSVGVFQIKATDAGTPGKSFFLAFLIFKTNIRWKNTKSNTIVSLSHQV